MEGLLILGVLVVIAIPVAIVYLLVVVAGLQRRVDLLGERVSALAGELRDSQPQTSAAPLDAPSLDKKATSPPVAESEPDKVAEPALQPIPDETPTLEAAVPTVGSRQKPEPAKKTPGPDRVGQAFAWLRENWFLAVAALSLVLAGVFLVQYGVENGLLTPFWRVAGAASLGLVMLGAGEFLRRRFGDDADDAAQDTEYLPSTFSGAGLVVLFAAVLSAHHLYLMMGEGATFFWLVLVALAGIALGWFYGSYLTMVGVLGAIGAPFMIGGSSDTPQLFFGYFGLIAVMALFVDAIRRWAWVSVLGLSGASLAATYIFALGAGDVYYLGFSVAMVLAAVLIPPLKLSPNHGGTMMIETLWRTPSQGVSWPEFPTALAVGAITGGTGATVLVALRDAGALEVWLAIGAVLVIFGLVVHWSRDGEALSDGALVGLPAILGILIVQAADHGSLMQAHLAGLTREPETGPPLVVTYLVGAGLVLSALAYWRGLFEARYANAWSAGAALAAPLVVLVIEANWRAGEVLGDFRWALHAMAVAGAMVFAAVGMARRDGEDRERASYFALSAAVMITLAMVVLYSETALTLAIAVLVVGSAYADRRFDLRLLNFFVAVGAVAIGWRLVFDPGVFWGDYAPLWEVILAYGGSIAALLAAWVLLGARDRWRSQMMVASAAWLAAAVFGVVLLWRWLGHETNSHWGLSLLGLVWLINAAVQMWRLQIGGKWFTKIRLGLAGLFGLIGILFIAAAISQNPITGWRQTILGVWVFSSLLVAYLLPAMVFGAVGWKFTHLPRWSRLIAGWVAAALAAGYLGLEIRHIWHGPDISGAGVKSGELYTYTLALLLTSVGLLFVAFLRRSDLLRKVAIAGVALTIAKVFLIDMSGLTGLIRVASFLGLGLSLAGLAWVVRVMNAQWEREVEE